VRGVGSVFSVKRLLLAPLAVALLLSGAVGASALTLSKQLLSPKQLPSWSRYYVGAAQLTGCPESSFQPTKSPHVVREFLVQMSSMTLLAEKLVVSSDPAENFESTTATVAKCRAAATIDGSVTFQRIKALNLGTFAVPVRAFSLYAVVGGAALTGCVVYASKGDVLLEIGELSMGSINPRAFRADVNLALERIRS